MTLQPKDDDMLLPKTSRPCPSWCTTGEGHPFEAENTYPTGYFPARSVSRFHNHVVGSVPVAINARTTCGLVVELVAEELVATAPAHVCDAYGDEQRDPVGPSTISPVLVEILAGDGPIPASAAQLREFAAVLERAAAVLEGLQP